VGSRAIHERIPTPHRRCPFRECPSHDGARSQGVVRHGDMKSHYLLDFVACAAEAPETSRS
jgi:hypothetical protein